VSKVLPWIFIWDH